MRCPKRKIRPGCPVVSPGVILALALVFLAIPASAQSLPLGDRPSWLAAIGALHDGRPAMAAEKLDQLLDAAENLPPADAESVRLLRLEALVRSRATSSALAALEDPAFAPSDEREFWRGLALLQARRFDEAVETFTPLEKSGFPYLHELQQNLAIARYRSGNDDRALETLRELADRTEAPIDVRQRARLTAARIEMERGRFSQARAWLEEDQDGSAIGERPPVSGSTAVFEHGLLSGRIALKQGRLEEAARAFVEVAEAAAGTADGDRAELGRADVALAQDRSRQAGLLLLELVTDRPDSPFLGSAFQRLASLGKRQLPGIDRKLEEWSLDETAPARRAYALFYGAIFARDAGEPDAAIAGLSDFLATNPRHPLRESAQLQLADTLIEAGRPEEAAKELERLEAGAVLPSTRMRLGLLRGRLQFSRDQAPDSLAIFRRVMEQETVPPSIREVAAYNGALAAAASGDPESRNRFAAGLGKLSGEGAEISGDLLLERGLLEARRSEPEAFETLETFVRQFSDHPHLADAQITLAEMYLNQVPPQAVSAREHLETAQDQALTLEQREWLDYVAIWVEVSAAQDLEAVDTADRFLRDWPRSERRASVYMLLGESYLRAGDFANAINAFESLGEEVPSSPLAEPALFFAARAAAESLDPAFRERAIDLWTRVAEGDGDLALSARHELGLLHLSLEQFDEAIAEFDRIADAEEVPSPLRIAALADKGESLFARASLPESESTALLEAAAEAFEEAGSDEAASKSWRLQAAVRRGKCLEALGKTEEALDLYREVVKNGAPAGPVAAAPISEFDWYYRAGLAAIRLLQETGDQQAAVAIADQVSQAGGPRAAEAVRIADHLRLRHFLWQDPGN